MLGIIGARCGSFASSGLPVLVLSPEIAHEFEPIPGPVGPSQRVSPSVDVRSRCNAPTASEGMGADAPFDPDVGALPASKTPFTTAPVVTIGRCSANGYGGKSFSV